GSRTPDLLNAIQALSQLSYGPQSRQAVATDDVGARNLGGAPPGIKPIRPAAQRLPLRGSSSRSRSSSSSSGSSSSTSSSSSSSSSRASSTSASSSTTSSSSTRSSSASAGAAPLRSCVTETLPCASTS